ncbi:hypothetical protein [Pseudodesulfovibrio piezophilus]|uniref:Uncharacterized protein n=1 Tax=Pseudodesulfovibrio piezophilus (strain DSM 21447 / JCM 15486 / C1TLV30) TaxID=1322246 RepID=M1WMD9_PSEP2|nr:hypothetical protein [Pseudodesulfovibrio piezophilus]CCH49435.1 protein of unknown function [Pseudodesulfovibrio piezophilus C1TLV30]
MVLLHLNTAWTQGIRAIPVPLSNKLKITHLDVKSTHGSLIQKQVLKIQIYLLRGMNKIMGLTTSEAG